MDIVRPKMLVRLKENFEINKNCQNNSKKILKISNVVCKVRYKIPYFASFDNNIV